MGGEGGRGMKKKGAGVRVLEERGGEGGGKEGRKQGSEEGGSGGGSRRKANRWYVTCVCWRGVAWRGVAWR